MKKKIRAILKKQDDKTSNVTKNILAAFVIKGGALLISLFTMPVYMDFFGDETVLGIWFTVLSMMSWILNFDLGIGNGLRNKLSITFAQKDTQKSKEYISSGYWAIGWLVLALSVIGWFVVPLCNWNAILNVDVAVLSPEIMNKTMRIVFLGMMLQFFLRLISSVLYALQKSSTNNLIALITSLSQLIFALVAPSRSASENLVMFAIAYVVCVNVPLIVATVIVFAKEIPECTPSIKFVKKDSIKSVIGLGGVFFLCQILFMVLANTNELLITNLVSPDCVVEYQVYYKLYSLGSTFITLALTPMWSAISKAYAENDFVWMNQSYKRLKQLGMFGILCEFLLIPFTQFLVRIWLGGNAIQVNPLYCVVFAVYGSTLMYQSVLSTIACGLGRLKLQVTCYSIAVVLKIVLVILGVQATHSWIVIVAVNAAVLIPYCVLEQLNLNRMMKKLLAN